MRPGSVHRRPRGRDRRQLRAHRSPGRDRRRERRHRSSASRTCRRRWRSTRASSTRATSPRCCSTSPRTASSTLDFDDEITARRVRHRQARGGIAREPSSLVIELTILVLAIFLGFEVISKVPTMLHTPLMSGTNFIHGIVIVGAIIVLGDADDTFLKVVGFVAMVLATRERRRRLLRHRPHARDVQEAPGAEAGEREAVISPSSRPDRPALPRHDRLLHPRAALPLVAEARAARELDRRRRHDRRDRQHAAARRHRQLGADRGRRR